MRLLRDPGFGPTRQNPDHVHADRVNRRSSYELTSAGVRVLQFRAVAALITVSTVLQLLFHWFGNVPGLRFVSWFFFVDSEQTIPAFYSTLTLLCCAALVAVVGWIIKPVNDVWGWRALSVAFALAGLDENAAIHEKAIEPIRNGLAIDSGPLYYAWVIPGALAVILLAAGFSGFLLRLPGDTRTRYLIAGALFVVGAIGFEALAASYVSGGIEVVAPDVDPDAARSGLLYMLLATIEEALEMVGAAMFLTATVAHMENHLGRRLSFRVLAITQPAPNRRAPLFEPADVSGNGGTRPELEWLSGRVRSGSAVDGYRV